MAGSGLQLKQDSLVGLLDKVSTRTLESLAPGVNAYLQSAYSIEAKLAEVRRTKLMAKRTGDTELLAVLTQVERDLEGAKAKPRTDYGGLLALVFIAFLLAILVFSLRTPAQLSAP